MKIRFFTVVLFSASVCVSSLFMKQSDEFAHGLNERVPVAAFYAGLDHWYVLLTTLAGTK